MNYQEIIEDPIFLKLELNQDWIESGVIDEKSFLYIKEKYLKGEDNNSEHYRWGAFKSFFTSNSTIDTETFYKLYNLGKNDSDDIMGRAIIFDLVNNPDCPMELIDAAINDGDFTLSKHASKRKSIRLK